MKHLKPFLIYLIPAWLIALWIVASHIGNFMWLCESFGDVITLVAIALVFLIAITTVLLGVVYGALQCIVKLLNRTETMRDFRL